MKNVIAGTAKFLEIAGGGIMYCMYFAGLCLHLYTILFAYQASGFLAALLSLIFPVLAQIYWVVATWIKTEQFINAYSWYVVVYLGWLIAAFVLVLVAGWLREKAS
jgi:hypothetical protein